MDEVTHRFTVRAGWLIRNRVLEEITAAAWQCNLHCTHERVGSAIRFTVKGRQPDIERLLEATSRWAARYNAAA